MKLTKQQIEWAEFALDGCASYCDEDDRGYLPQHVPMIHNGVIVVPPIPPQNAQALINDLENLLLEMAPDLITDHGEANNIRGSGLAASKRCPLRS